LAIEVGEIGIFETDLRRRRTRFSPQLCAILGLPEGTEMPYDAAMQLIDESDRAALVVSAEAAAKSPDEGKWSGLCRVLRPDGVIRQLCIHGRRIYQQTVDGLEPLRSMGVVLDVTHLKETEDALRESERRLRFALEAARMGTFELDISRDRAFIDAQEARLLGLPSGTRAVSADVLRKRVPIEDLRRSDIKKERLKNGEAYDHEFRLGMPDGSERWLSAHADLRSNRLFGVNFDITERKRAEEKLRESEARLRVATSGAALGVFEWDPETDRTVWENDRIYEIFARRRTEGPVDERRLISNYVHPDDARQFDAELEKSVQSGADFHTICRIKREDGAQRWLLIHGRFTSTAGGGQPRLVGVVADITERKLLEQRTKELTECLVTIQEEERKQISRELHDSTAQHLVAVTLNLLSLRPADLDCPETKRRWDETESCLDKAMNELRTFSYLMHPLSLEADGLCAAIRQFVDGYQERTGLDVKCRLDSSADNLPYQKQRTLLRIAQEALSNAHRHAAASRVMLQLRWIADRVHLIVSDNGSGSRGSRAAAGPGHGIRGMLARVRQYGGDLRICDRATGTKVHAAVPANFGTDPTEPFNVGYVDAATQIDRTAF
jgi:PAS domain S-box-containing protein